MQASRVIIKNIQSKLAANVGSDCFVSQLVIRTEHDTPYLAIFAAPRQAGQPEGRIGRPTIYCLCDFNNGNMISAFHCSKRDFTNASYKETYSLTPRREPDDDFLDRLYIKLDRVRQTILETNAPDIYERLYQSYMESLFEIIPEDYEQFYRDLSILPEHGLKMTIPNAPDVYTEPEQQEPEEKPVQRPQDEQEDVPETKTYTASSVNWHPAVNLSTLPERNFRVIEKVANYIKFLPTDKPNQIRYEYPLFCYTSDQQEDVDMWQELLVRLSNGDIKTGHFRVAPKKNIYSICASGKTQGCIFGRCPYIVAAYIRYLKENDPERLKEERAVYLEKRFAYDMKYSDRIDYEIEIPGNIDEQKLLAGLALSDGGNVAITKKKDGTILLSWLEDLGPKGIQIQKRIIPEQEFAYKEIWTLHDKNGDEIPEAIAYAALADYLDRKGWDTRKQSKKEEAEKVKQEVVSTPPAPTQQEPKEPSMQEADIMNMLAKYTPSNGNAYRCLGMKQMNMFYGTIVTEDPSNSPALNALKQRLKTFGVTDEVFCTLEDFVAKNGKIEPHTLYCVYGITETSNIAPLRAFFPNAYIVLCGTRETLTPVFRDAVVKSIYGRCSMRDPVKPKNPITNKQEFARFYRALTPALQDMLNTDGAADKYIAWSKARQTPANSDALPEYLAWQCTVENRLPFITNERGTQS